VIDPSRLRRSFAAAVRALISLRTHSPSLRLLADQAARALGGISQALDALVLLADDPVRVVPRRRSVRLTVPDWLPALVNGSRAFVTIGAAELFWILTAWPSGAQAITFAMIAVLLFSPRADQAYAITVSFMIGTCLTAAFAAIVNFAVLPGLETFAGFSLAIGLVLVPAGALMAQPWQTAMFTAMTANFIPLLAPANRMSYDTEQFYNSTLGIVAGVGAAAFVFRLLPPLSPAFRARRLLALTLRDLRRLAKEPVPRSLDDWKHRLYGRLAVLPDAAEPLQRAQLMAALAVGAEMIRLRHAARRFDLDSSLDVALDALARGDSAGAVERLSKFDRVLATLPGAGSGAGLRARASLLRVCHSLTWHAAYFDSGAAP
jgi:uncharacterized membrane protein YccC